jgi:hypothetical protein
MPNRQELAKLWSRKNSVYIWPIKPSPFTTKPQVKPAGWMYEKPCVTAISILHILIPAN